MVALVEQALKLDPFAPAVYVFTNKRRDRVKLILWNRTGFWLLIKRLEADRLAWPREAAVLELTVDQLHWLLDGVDLAAMMHACEWVVYAKRPFAGPQAVLAYLSRYTHRVAISNQRLIALDERGVTFRWKDQQWVKALRCHEIHA